MTAVVAAAVGAAGVVLVGSGFVGTLPSLLGGGARLQAMEIPQPVATPFPSGPRERTGFDVSFPQCGKGLPEPTKGFAIVGLTGGRPFVDQPCLPDQAWWAQQFDGFAVYVNSEYDGVADPAVAGAAIADDAHTRMDRQYLAAATPVWLDVETDNNWHGTVEQNAALIAAAARRLGELGHPVGVYSAPKLWRNITGGVDPGMPTWLAIGQGTQEKAEAACGRIGFGGRTPEIVQWIENRPDGTPLDHDVLCQQSATGLLMPTGNANAG